MNNNSEHSNEQHDRLPDSDSYLKKLESKLSKVRGEGKELKSKELISVIREVREGQAVHRVLSDYESSFLSDLDGDKEVSSSFLERKLFPEKSALTFEELQELLKSDVLAKQTVDYMEETQSEPVTER